MKKIFHIILFDVLAKLALFLSLYLVFVPDNFEELYFHLWYRYQNPILDLWIVSYCVFSYESTDAGHTWFSPSQMCTPLNHWEFLNVKKTF